MQTTSEQKKGIAGTIIFHLLLVIAFLFLALRTPLPLPGDEGVEIRMGDSDEGTFSENIGQISASTPATTSSSQAEEEIVTQTEEETVAIETSKKPEIQQKKPEEKPVTETKPEPKPEPKPTVDPRALYTGNNTTTSGGGTGTSGDYGRPDGTSTMGGLTGGGQGDGQGSGYGDGQGGSGSGSGQGRDYFLRGREIKSLKKPAYNSGEQGRVVVEIFVDKEGNVTKARAGAKVPDSNIGTTTSDPTLWKQAEDAALQSKFSKDDKATEQQRGYIVYNFVKQGE
jgi:outer membrane biosynthesis protein TonB